MHACEFRSECEDLTLTQWVIFAINGRSWEWFFQQLQFRLPSTSFLWCPRTTLMWSLVLPSWSSCGCSLFFLSSGPRGAVKNYILSHARSYVDDKFQKLYSGRMFFCSHSRFEHTLDGHSRSAQCRHWCAYVCVCRGSAVRAAWYVVHWLFGTALVILGWFNIFKGLDEYIQSWAGGERKVRSITIYATVDCFYCKSRMARISSFSNSKRASTAGAWNWSWPSFWRLVHLRYWIWNFMCSDIILTLNFDANPHLYTFVQAWYVIWGVQIALLSFIYLFMDRLPHIQRQSQDPSLINPNVAKDIPLGTHDKGMERSKFVSGHGSVWM